MPRVRINRYIGVLKREATVALGHDHSFDSSMRNLDPVTSALLYKVHWTRSYIYNFLVSMQRVRERERDFTPVSPRLVIIDFLTRKLPYGRASRAKASLGFSRSFVIISKRYVG